MKKKLVITVDAGLLTRAKRYARTRGISLSSCIEQSLTEEDALSFTSRWRGRFNAACGDDPRYDALVWKHL